MPAMMKLFAVMIMLLGAKTDSVLTEKGKTMSEYIKREDMLAIFSQTRSIANAMESFMHLPSADVIERKTGKWIDKGDRYWYCSECGVADTDTFPVCHGCGADMRSKIAGKHTDQIIIDEAVSDMKGKDNE